VKQKEGSIRLHIFLAELMGLKNWERNVDQTNDQEWN